MKHILSATTILTFLILSSCQKNNCQTCTKTIGGFAGNITDEVKEVCNDNEATELEATSSGTTVWECE
jgi:hypothetical protein